MRKFPKIAFLFLTTIFVVSCKNKATVASADTDNEIKLKKGAIISCSPGETKLGNLDFKINSSREIQDEFNTGLKLLHSFEYDESEKLFASIIEKDPGCAMAYWGVAMSNFHPLWAPPTGEELKKGSWAADKAKQISKDPKETAYIHAIASFYADWKKEDHKTRTLRFEKSMEQLHQEYADDPEAAIFYALALDAAADPADKTFVKQKKAASILQDLELKYPNHPGIIHYIIHSYDAPQLASFALPAARKYAAVAPSSAHALHMPSHIFTRLGLWSESIQSNLVSVASAKCYAEQSGIKGHWDEELHGLDYLVYAYLQRGQNDSAKYLWDYLNTIKEVSPANFKVAYAFAAIPSRYLLENRLWNEASGLEVNCPAFSWKDYPWQYAIIHFTRAMGSANSGKPDAAKKEIKELQNLHDTLVNQKDEYKANQVMIQIKTAGAWLAFREGKAAEALMLMNAAADMEDKTGKHSVTPGEVIPARELLGDLLMLMNQPAKALEAYRIDLENHNNRLNGLAGAALAATKSNDHINARNYWNQLVSVTDPHSPRLSAIQKEMNLKIN